VREQAQYLRRAIEELMNAKLHDALARPGGLDRLIAHRCTGVASHPIRVAEHQLEDALVQTLEVARKFRPGPVAAARRMN